MPDPGFQSFATAQKNRTPMVYVGANDGMMHAFNDSTGPDAGQGNLGVRAKGVLQQRRPERHTPRAQSVVPDWGAQL